MWWATGRNWALGVSASTIVQLQGHLCASKGRWRRVRFGLQQRGPIWTPSVTVNELTNNHGAVRWRELRERGTRLHTRDS